MDEGAFALCMDLVVSNSAEVQQQATRAMGNLALSDAPETLERMIDEVPPRPITRARRRHPSVAVAPLPKRSSSAPATPSTGTT
eukprot:793376-Prymnesium_polylepis.1